MKKRSIKKHKNGRTCDMPSGRLTPEELEIVNLARETFAKRVNSKLSFSDFVVGVSKTYLLIVDRHDADILLKDGGESV